MPDNEFCGWDLGGAHIKLARLDAGGRIVDLRQTSCPLWRGLERLHAVIGDGVQHTAAAARHAVTMTGELADVFPDRTTGVRELIGAMEQHLPPAKLRIYAGARGFVATQTAKIETDSVASANWLAGATLLAQRLGDCILVDIGSTTTDLVPCADGRVRARGHSDHERLAVGELIYSGVVRTPVPALAQRVAWGGAWIDLMNETFATAADVYRLTGDLQPHQDLMPSADHAGKSERDSARRLARMLGLDYEDDILVPLVAVASQIKRQHLQRLAQGFALIASRRDVPVEAPVVGAGSGRFLAAELAGSMGRRYIDFADLFEHCVAGVWNAADCAPAVAVAALVGHDDV